MGNLGAWMEEEKRRLGVSAGGYVMIGRNLSEAEKEQIRQRYAAGEPRSQLSVQYDCSDRTISRLTENIEQCQRNPLSDAERQRLLSSWTRPNGLEI